MNWIWLNEKKYPEFYKSFTTRCTKLDKDAFAFTVASFKKRYTFGKAIKSATINVSADSSFQLFINDKFVGMGPVSSGGDFLCTESAPKHYYNTYEINEVNSEINIYCLVKLLPQVLTEYGRGHGGLALCGEILFEDGTKEIIESDETWDCRPESSYNDYCSFNSSLPEYSFDKAVITPDIWQAEKSYIPMLQFEDVLSEIITVTPGETLTKEFELDKIWGAYPIIKADGKCEVLLETYELPGQSIMEENMAFGKAGEYFSFRMHSIGNVRIKIKNTSDNEISVSLTLKASYYPIDKEGKFVCSDDEFNKVYETCKHTLKICRQTIHLDSTSHQELLACTGDYYIESLISLYAYGDMRLAEFDVMRTADWLCKNNGRMFHTTYSLIWVQMLRDVYYMTGNKSLLKYCENALDKLLAKFDTYKGENGLIESPPDFMFVDWTVIDGYNMHHPPKALGQTVLNAFYYEAINKAAEIYGIIGRNDRKKEFIGEAKEFKDTFNYEFWDDELQLYFDGKTDEYGDDSTYLPKNADKKYFSKYPNILAAAYGLIDGEDASDLMTRIIKEDSLQDIQPYFMHYMMKAVRKTGLFPKYGMDLLSRWKAVVKDCDKGLAEGWIAPVESYSFDHSHAWGGTVAYQLPSVISGMEIIEPGMKKLKFTPCLYGLEFADIKISTKYGNIDISLSKDKEPIINAPKEIEILKIL